MNFQKFEGLIKKVVDVIVGILVIFVVIVMCEAVFEMVKTVVPLPSLNSLSSLIEEIATLFIMLEVILMLLRYVREGHHIPVRYLILISITAISRQILLNHGSGLESLLLALSILVLVGVLFLLEKVKAFSKHKD